jgi:hypothetical protein
MRIYNIVSRVFLFYIIFSFLSIPICSSALGDGGIIGKGGSGQIFYVEETTQYAVIDHTKGIQSMFVSINFNWEESEKTAWIFPVPSDPAEIDVEVADGIPIFHGNDIEEDAHSELSETAGITLFSYLLSAAIPLPWSLSLLWVLEMNLATTGVDVEGGSGVTVHKHLEQDGLIVEVISALKGEGIYNYLSANGLDVSTGIIPELDKYVNNKFSFTVTWFEENNNSERAPGIILEFPTDKIYFPLMLTSLYDENIIPVEVMISGYVSPEIYDEIKPYTSVSYMHWGGVDIYQKDKFDAPRTYRFLLTFKENWDETFTRIKIKAPSNQFKEDLWVENKEPSGSAGHAISIHKYFNYHTKSQTTLLIVALLSFLISMLLGIAIFGRDKSKLHFYFLFGFMHLLGICILIIFAIGINIKRKEQFPNNKMVLFIVLFITIFLSAISAIFLILLYPLL